MSCIKCGGVVFFWASYMVLEVKNLPANAGNTRDVDSIPGLGRSCQYSCLENPMDRKPWWATVRRVAKSWTRLKWLNTHTVFFILPFFDRNYKTSELFYKWLVKFSQWNHLGLDIWFWNVLCFVCLCVCVCVCVLIEVFKLHIQII